MRGRVVPVLAALVCLLPARAQAAWVRNGDSLCTAVQGQSNASIVSDNAGGAVVVWRDLRNGMGSDLYARAVNANGGVQWSATGIPVCVAANDQTNQSITTDGKGGAIVVWQDSRKTTASSAIYAQRIRANGLVVWTANGIPVDTLTGYQTSPVIVPDGAGGAIVAWDATRSGRAQIYAQRFDSLGVAKWSAGGVAVAPTLTEQSYVVMAPDGANGALLAWYDARSTAGGYNSIYAQRLTSSGTVPAPWPPSGVPVCDATLSPWIPVIAPSDSGGEIIAWEDYRNYATSGANIYAQRVAADATVRWAANGIPICTAALDQTYPSLVSDAAGGAIIAWQDDRATATSATFYAQRVSAGGVVAWTADGVSLCNASSHRSDMTLIQDGSGGAISTWVDFRSGVATDIYAQRVGANGVLAWGASGAAVCDTSNNQQLPVLVGDGAHGAVIAWHDNRSSNYDVYAQRLGANGQMWGATAGVALAAPELELAAPRPNPSGGSVALAFRLPAAAPVEAAIFDVAGRCVRRLAGGERFDPGAHVLTWDGRDAAGAPSPAGLYFVRAACGPARAEARIVRIR